MTTINPLVTSPSTLPQPANTAQAASQDVFQSVLSMLLSGAMSGNESGQPMMAPVMALLLDRLVELQVRSGESEDAVQAEASVARAAVGAFDEAEAKAPAGTPVQGGRITQVYHGAHNGLDFGVPVGTPVVSTMSGKVIYSGWNNQGYGNLVIVESGAYRTYYAHLSELSLEVGEQVRAGDVVALSGNTGNSTGPHLHYEVRYQNQAIDPGAC